MFGSVTNYNWVIVPISNLINSVSSVFGKNQTDRLCSPSGGGGEAWGGGDVDWSPRWGGGAHPQRKGRWQRRIKKERGGR